MWLWFKKFKLKQRKLQLSESVTKIITCDYCRYRFISNVDKGITYCPKCKNMIKIGMAPTSIFGKFRALPVMVKYALIVVLIVLLLVLGVLPLIGIKIL